MDAAELEWIAWTTPITTAFGEAVAASDFSGRTVACRQHITADTICIVAPLVQAETADNIARIHVEAIGGKMRLGLLQSLKAEGQVLIDERRLEFTLLAQRPNRLRMETRSGERTTYMSRSRS